MDYQKKGEEELDLAKDDALRVFKRYNHWSYAVKEVGGDRGWVPVSLMILLRPNNRETDPIFQSWFIGKVSASGVVPQTPNSSTTMQHPTGLGDEPGQSQISPMSSAFPPDQSQRTPNVI